MNTKSRGPLEDFFNIPAIRNSVIGVDSIFDNLERITRSNLIPWNIIRTSEDTWVIECAVAGFSKDEIKVELLGDTLKVSGSQETKQKIPDYLHKGIKTSDFVIPFTLFDGVKVGTVSLKDGMLRIVLEKRKTLLSEFLEINEE